MDGSTIHAKNVFEKLSKLDPSSFARSANAKSLEFPGCPVIFYVLDNCSSSSTSYLKNFLMLCYFHCCLCIGTRLN